MLPHLLLAGRFLLLPHLLLAGRFLLLPHLLLAGRFLLLPNLLLAGRLLLLPHLLLAGRLLLLPHLLLAGLLLGLFCGLLLRPQLFSPCLLLGLLRGFKTLTHLLGTSLLLRLFCRLLLRPHLRVARLLLCGARCVQLGGFGIKLTCLACFGIRLLLTHLLVAGGFTLLRLLFLHRFLFGGLGGFPQLAHLLFTIFFTLLLLRLAQGFLLLLLLHLRLGEFPCPLTHLLVIGTVFLQLRRFFRIRHRILFQTFGCFPTFFIHDRFAL